MNFPIKQLILSILSINTALASNLMIATSTMAMVAPATTIIAQTTNPQDAEAYQLLEEAENARATDTLEGKQKAISLLERALGLYEKSGNQSGQAFSLLQIGLIYDDLAEKKLALEYYERSLPFWQKLNDQWGKAAVFNNMGMVYNDLGEKQKALEYYEKSLPLSEAIGDQSLYSRTLNNIGLVYDDLGEKQKALQFYEKSLPISASLEDQYMQGRTLNNIGLVYDSLGEKQKALEYYAQAQPFSEAAGDRFMVGRIFNNIGLVYSDLGEKQKALEYYEKSLPIAQSVGDQYLVARIFNNMGIIHGDLGEQQKALNHYEQALPAAQTIGDQDLVAKIFNNMGLVYDRLGEMQKAIEYYEKSLPIAEAIGDRSLVAMTLSNLGIIYNSLGQSDQAIKYYERSLPLSEVTGDIGQQARTLNNIGLVYANLDKQRKALDYYKRSLPIAEKVGDRFLQAITLNNIGVLHDGLGEWQEALTYYEKSLPISESVGDRSQAALTLNNIGLIYARQNQINQAIPYYEKSLALSKAIVHPTNQAIALYNLANAYFQQENFTEALKYIKEAVAIVENLRTKLVNQDLRTAYFATVQEYYILYIDVLMFLHRRQPDQGYDQQALHISERTKARGLLELLTESKIDIRQGVDIKLLNQEKSLIAELNRVENDRLKYLAETETNSQKIAELSKKIDQLFSQLDQIEAQIKQTSPRYAQLTQPNILTVKQIQAEILDENTVLLEYLVGTQASYLWVVSKNNLTTYMIPGKKELRQAVNEFRRILTNPRTQDNLSLIEAKASELSQMILAPASQQINGKRLLVVSDGPLQYIPFATLTLSTKNHTYQPLISQQAVINLPSASTLAMIRQDTANRSLATKKIAVIADPVFSPDDQRLAQRPRTNLDDAIAMVDISRGTESAGMNWERLPFTRQEAEAITALVPENESKKVLDFQADYQNVMEGDLSQYQIIHLATHGFVNTEQPELSAIVLSLFNQQGVQENGYLRLNDIFNLNLPAELVVLSACQTGLGKEIKGEGLVGLTRGFMYAGAKRVLVSLWNVNDEKTAELMTIFYREMLQKNTNPAESFRLAQVEMWQKGYSPYYWAPFIFQGEPE